MADIAPVGSPGAVAIVSGAAIAPSYPQTPTAGDLLTAWVTARAATAAIAESTGWTKIGEAVNATNNVRAALFWKRAAGGDAPPSFSAAGAAAMRAQISEWSSAGTAPVVVTGTATATGSSISVSTDTPVTESGGLALSVVAQYKSNAQTCTLTPSAGWTELGSYEVSNNDHAAGSYLLNPATGATLSETETMSRASSIMASLIAVIQPGTLVTSWSEWVQSLSPRVWYRLNEIAAGTITDSSGNAHDATLTAGGVPAVPGSTGDGDFACELGGGAQINTPFDYIAATFGAVLSYGVSFKTTAGGPIAGEATSDLSGNIPTFYVSETDGQIYSCIWWAVSTAIAPGDFRDGEWHRLLVTWDGATQSVYVDGVLRATSTGSIANYGPVSRWIGVAWGGTGGFPGLTANAWNWFPGTLDEVVVLERAMSAQEVAEDYSWSLAGFPGIQPGQVSYVGFVGASDGLSSTSCSFAENPKAGSSLLVAAAVFNETTLAAPTVTDNAGNAYAQVSHGGFTSGGWFWDVYFFKADNIALPVGPLTITLNGPASSGLTVYAEELIGSAAGVENAFQNSDTTGTSTQAFSAATDPDADSLFFVASLDGVTGSAVYSTANGFKLRAQQTENSTYQDLAVAAKGYGGGVSGTQTGAINLGGPGLWAMATVALSPQLATPQTLAPPSLTAHGTVRAPSVVKGTVTVHPPSLSAQATVRIPLVTAPPPQAVTPSSLSALASVRGASVAPGERSLQVPSLAAIAHLQGPLVVAGERTLAPPTQVAEATAWPPLVNKGTVAFSPASLTTKAQLQAPSIVLGQRNIAPVPLSGLAELRVPSMTGGAVIQPTNLRAVATLWTPTVVAPAATGLHPPALSAVAAAVAPEAAPGPVTLATPSLGVLGRLRTPSFRAPTPLELAPPSLSAAAQLWTPLAHGPEPPVFLTPGTLMAVALLMPPLFGGVMDNVEFVRQQTNGAAGWDDASLTDLIAEWNCTTCDDFGVETTTPDLWAASARVLELKQLALMDDPKASATSIRTGDAQVNYGSSGGNRILASLIKRYWQRACPENRPERSWGTIDVEPPKPWELEGGPRLWPHQIVNAAEREEESY